jgi:hypothetical protein
MAAGCPGASEERARDDLEIGNGSAAGVSIAVADGLAHVRDMEEGAITLWAQSPVLDVTLDVDSGAVMGWVLAIHNCMPGAELVATSESGAAVAVTALDAERPTSRRWLLALPPGDRVMIRVAPADAEVAEPWRVVVMGDIQQGLPTVDEMFDAINRTPGARMVMSTGDLVEDGLESEYRLLATQLETLGIPYYSTIGNHELFGDTDRWKRRFGRFNIHFTFKGVTFSFVDSANASIDPMIYEWLDGWLAARPDGLHVFGTHFPPLDPFGVRSGSFRSRKEAAKLLSRLSAGGVDLTLYGHIHSYYGYSNAGIEAHISGGGGAAFAETWDGVGRHFLTVDFDPAAETFEVHMVPVD